MITSDPSLQVQENSRTFLFWLLGTTLLALILRVAFLGNASFWVDEIYSVMHAARLGEGNITKQFGFLPTYIVLILTGTLPGPQAAMDPSTWSSLGITEWLVRLPSLIDGVATVPILGWL